MQGYNYDDELVYLMRCEGAVVSQDYDFSKEREALAKQYGISVGKVTLYD